jgi:hypothetical protein
MMEIEVTFTQRGVTMRQDYRTGLPPEVVSVFAGQPFYKFKRDQRGRASADRHPIEALLIAFVSA